MCIPTAPWRAMSSGLATSSSGIRGSGGGCTHGSGGRAYTWAMLEGDLARAPFQEHYSVHNTALKYYRFIGEPAPGEPLDWDGIEVPLEPDTVNIGTVKHAPKGTDFEVDTTTMQPWPWRAMLTQLKKPIKDDVDNHGGVVHLRCASIRNTCGSGVEKTYRLCTRGSGVDHMRQYGQALRPR